VLRHLEKFNGISVIFLLRSKQHLCIQINTCFNPQRWL